MILVLLSAISAEINYKSQQNTINCIPSVFFAVSSVNFRLETSNESPERTNWPEKRKCLLNVLAARWHCTTAVRYFPLNKEGDETKRSIQPSWRTECVHGVRLSDFDSVGFLAGKKAVKKDSVWPDTLSASYLRRQSNSSRRKFTLMA